MQGQFGRLYVGVVTGPMGLVVVGYRGYLTYKVLCLKTLADHMAQGKFFPGRATVPVTAGHQEQCGEGIFR